MIFRCWCTAVVLVAPFVSPRPIVNQISQVLSLNDAGHRRLVERIEHRVGLAIRDIELDRPTVAVDVPVLIAHDQRDPVTPLWQVMAITKAWPTARLYSTTGLGHNRILRDANTVQQITSFLQRIVQVPDTPSDLNRLLDTVELSGDSFRSVHGMF